jgi:hypothetical protein
MIIILKVNFIYTFVVVVVVVVVVLSIFVKVQLNNLLPFTN